MPLPASLWVTSQDNSSPWMIFRRLSELTWSSASKAIESGVRSPRIPSLVSHSPKDHWFSSLVYESFGSFVPGFAGVNALKNPLLS